MSGANRPIWHRSTVTREARWARHGARGATVWLTGLSGSGKSTVADGVAQALLERSVLAYVLDADNVRHGLNSDLGFSADDRSENVRRLGEVALLFADAGLIVLVPVISPFVADRDRVRVRHRDAGLAFVEVHVATPLDECERRDTKGLYAEVRGGRAAGLSGLDAPYEAPVDPEVVVGSAGEGVPDSVGRVVEHLRQSGVMSGADA